MKTEQEINDEIKAYEKIIEDFYMQPEDYEERHRIQGKIDVLKWVIGDCND